MVDKFLKFQEIARTVFPSDNRDTCINSPRIETAVNERHCPQGTSLSDVGFSEDDRSSTDDHVTTDNDSTPDVSLVFGWHGHGGYPCSGVIVGCGIDQAISGEMGESLHLDSEHAAQVATAHYRNIVLENDEPIDGDNGTEVVNPDVVAEGNVVLSVDPGVGGDSNVSSEGLESEVSQVVLGQITTLEHG